jgi:NAD(P)H-hydrate epimerase
MIGAPALAANAALRAGAGLVRVAAPASVQMAVATVCPCATSVPLPVDETGAYFGADAVEPLLTEARAHDVLAVGPGIGVCDSVADAMVSLLECAERPMVVDADGLNNLASQDTWPKADPSRLVLTPHPGEFARLASCSTQQVQADRQQRAARFAADHGGLVVVLKGRGTVVTDGRRSYVNATGNPGMATGGSGDVLTGVIAALIGQGLSPYDAACLGVYVHGRAGDLAAERLGELSLIATDLIDFLPEAFRAVS